ncbi:MAG: gamma-glutamylcyclotransferase [Alphaproteobacteria bacterium]|jgi:cation transport protein ChaC|nr:gamma-glutamylcyclotransferase [Alphaproteobacteria bacterium]HJP21842.1 gamma-glutamylcyclotransferase [Alphaproteobacteria bacterium]
MLKREDIVSGRVEALIIEAERLGLMERLPPAERAASCRAAIARFPSRDNVWVFAYGSLIWSPSFHYVERRPAIIYGYHRRYCLWAMLGRGSPEQPGLMLGLEPGGACAGAIFRVAPEAVESELGLLWDREMISGAYFPRILQARSGEQVFPAVAFAVNRSHERYAGRLSLAEVADVLAVAEGDLGSCCDYLFHTVTHLKEMGVSDRRLSRLKRLVEERRTRQAETR